MQTSRASNSTTDLSATAPAGYLITSAVIVVVIAILAFYQMTQQPWIGARFTPAEDLSGIVVKSVQAHGPSSGILYPGQKLLSISDSHNTVFLDPIILEEPNNLPSYDEFNRSLNIQDEIREILRAPSVRLQDSTGEWLTIEQENTRPFSAIPAVYWLYPVMASIGVFLGVLIWLRQPKEPVSYFLLILGWAYFIGMCEMMLIDRELALRYAYLKTLLSLENIFTNLFVAALLSIFMSYPARLVPVHFCIAVFFIIITFPLNSTMQWLEIPKHAFMAHFLVVHASIFLCIYLQWKAAYLKPFNRAILLWAILWMTIPTATALLMFVAPVALGSEPILPIESARLIMSFYSIGMAFGVFRYRLFDVEKWWFMSLFWLMGGLMVIGLDILFVLLLHIQPMSAISLSLIVAGFLYFPARQWLFSRMLPDRQKTLEERITNVMKELSSSVGTTSSNTKWKDLISNYFNPAEVLETHHPFQSAALINSGLSLQIPHQSGNPGLVISGKHFGKKLFNKEDVKHVEALHTLTAMVQQANDAAEEAAKEERLRIMQDLHDTMGAQLLTLIHRSSSEEYTVDVRDTLQSMRNSVQLMARSGPVFIDELIAEWRTDIREKTVPHGIQLNWPITSETEDSLALPSHHILPADFLVRELLELYTSFSTLEQVSVSFDHPPSSITFHLEFQSREETSSTVADILLKVTAIKHSAVSLAHSLKFSPSSSKNGNFHLHLSLQINLNTEQEY